MLLSDDVQLEVLEKWKTTRSNKTCKEWLKNTHDIDLSRWALRRLIHKLEKQNTVPLSSDKQIEQKVNFDKQLEGLRAEANHYKRLYNQAQKDASGIDKVVSVAKEITNAIPAISVHYKEIKINAQSSQVAIAPLCDTHIGEKVDLEQMNGLNEYNMDIFNRRLHLWAERIIGLTKLREKYVNIPDLYVPMLGDMVSGDIHLELIKSNIDNVMHQMIRGANLISQALIFMSPYFRHIYVPCVVGNHGRTTIKPPAKDKFVDWDYLMYQWIAAYCRNQKNISFNIPKSFMLVFEAANRKILIMHGDSIKSWSGIPHYGINRTIAQLRQTMQIYLHSDLEKALEKLRNNPDSTAEDMINTLSFYFDAVMLGHFHRHDELDIGTGFCFICGCMKGGDEYSFGRLHTISRPMQFISFWHPKHGYISKDIIYLEKLGNEKFNDVLPEIWIDAEQKNG